MKRSWTKGFRLRRTLSALELSAAHDERWSLWVEVGGAVYRSQAKTERPAGQLLRLPLVDLAVQELDLDAQVALRELPGLRVPLPDPVKAEELCALALTTGDCASANWLLRQLGREAVNRHLHKIGARNSQLDSSFSDIQQNGETSLRDAMLFLQRSTDHSEQARWLRRNRREDLLGAWLPDEIDVWHYGSADQDAVHAVAVIGDRPRWRIGCLTDGQEETAAAYMGHQALRIRQALLVAKLIRSGA